MCVSLNFSENRPCFVVVVLDPVCEVVQSSVDGRRDATLSCRMTYDWQAPSRQFNAPPGLEVSLSWTGVPGTTVTATADPSTYSGTVQTNATLENIALEIIPSYTCTVEFQFSPGVSTLYQYAVNPVSSTCVTEPTPVRCK